MLQIHQTSEWLHPVVVLGRLFISSSTNVLPPTSLTTSLLTLPCRRPSCLASTVYWAQFGNGGSDQECRKEQVDSPYNFFFVYLEDTFGSVPHSLIQETLMRNHLPENLLLPHILLLQLQVIQGNPLSPTIFLMVFNPVLLKLKIWKTSLATNLTMMTRSPPSSPYHMLMISASLQPT